MNTLTATGLAKSYRGREVVKSVDLRVESEQIVGLLGPNGAGKTTCFYMIVGLVRGDQGEIQLNGKPLAHLPMHRRAQMGLGYLPQEASVFRGLTVEQNIRAILELRKDLSKEQQDEKLEQLLDDFQVHHIRDSLGIALSGGERRSPTRARRHSL